MTQASAGKMLYLNNTTSGPANPTAVLESAAAGDKQIGGYVAADSYDRWILTATPALLMGSGAAATDTTLNRIAAGVPGLLTAGGTQLLEVGAYPSSAFTTGNAANTLVTVSLFAVQLAIGDLTAGAEYEITGGGYYVGGQTTSESIGLEVAIGGTTTGITSTPALGISGTGRWQVQALLQILTTGSGGTCACTGVVTIAATVVAIGQTSAAPTTAVNTTIANALAFRGTWGGQGGSNQNFVPVNWAVKRVKA